MFLLQLAIGAILICLTVVIHAFALDFVMKTLEKLGPKIYKFSKQYWKTLVLTYTVLSTFLAHITQIWLWAAFYISIGALDSFEEALYFSTSVFTTVGFGDVVLGHDWRLVSSFQAANGFILFGWSTAFIFEIMSKLYKEERINKTEKK